MTLYAESAADQTDHFADAFVMALPKTVWIQFRLNILSVILFAKINSR